MGSEGEGSELKVPLFHHSSYQHLRININNDLTLTGLNYYAGATDVTVEGEWRWQSDNALLSIGTVIYNSAINWHAAELDGGTAQNCLAIGYSLQYYGDVPCSSLSLFICEHPCILIFA